MGAMEADYLGFIGGVFAALGSMAGEAWRALMEGPGARVVDGGKRKMVEVLKVLVKVSVVRWLLLREVSRRRCLVAVVDVGGGMGGDMGPKKESGATGGDTGSRYGVVRWEICWV